MALLAFLPLMVCGMPMCGTQDYVQVQGHDQSAGGKPKCSEHQVHSGDGQDAPESEQVMLVSDCGYVTLASVALQPSLEVQFPDEGADPIVSSHIWNVIPNPMVTGQHVRGPPAAPPSHLPVYLVTQRLRL